MEQIILSQMYHFWMTMVVCTITLPPPITYEAVDLGLPSGTKWATTNVGARKPSDYGLYFQWGDTQGYTAEQVGKDKQFASDYSDYKWYLSGIENVNLAFKKYNTAGSILELEDDAAHVNMGGEWHMPSPTQIKELIDNATSAWTKSDGVSGVTFTSKKDTSKFIFIPAEGWAANGTVSYSVSDGYVFSSMLYTDNAAYIQSLHFYFSKIPVSASGAYLIHYKRYYGYSIRGVIG